MLNVFPALLTYSLIAPVILRVALGVFFILAGIKVLKERKASMGKEIFGLRIPTVLFLSLHFIGALLVIVGAWTQIGALILFLLSGISMLLRKKYPSVFLYDTSIYVFALVIAFSLMLSGAGFLAFDLPL